MPSITVNNKIIELGEQGFLSNPKDWSPDIGALLAKQDNLILTDAHFEILNFLRDFYFEFQHIPRQRILSKAIAQSLGEEKAATLYLSQLFNGNPVKLACKYAGLPKPPHCI